MASEKGVRFQRILFPTDFTEASENAASYALSLARQHRARLHVLHVVDITGEAAGFYVPHQSFETLNEEMKAGAEDMIERFCARTFPGLRNIERRVLIGEPYKQIIKVVKGSRIDLVVMGTYGKSGIDRLLFGSTTERVLRKAGCPVLVIPPAG
jgi:nucleotide-binding universal stress UspA family protein